MADLKISQTPEKSTLSSTDLIPIVDNDVIPAVTKHVSASVLDDKYSLSALSTNDIPDSTDKRYVTDAEKAIIDNTSINGHVLGGRIVLTKSDIGLSNINDTSDADKPISTAVQTALDAKQNSLGFTAENISYKGAASGYAPLDTNSKVPSANLPASFGGALTYKGVWDASGETYPSNPSTGYYYIASVAGTISGTTYAVNDWMVYNGTSWDKIDNQNIVASVAGKTGTVTLTTADVSDSLNKRYVTDAQKSDLDSLVADMSDYARLTDAIAFAIALG